MVEENESREENSGITLPLAYRPWRDDVYTVLSADGNIAIAQQMDGTVVERALLQSVETVEGRGEIAVPPLSVPADGDCRYGMFVDDPYLSAPVLRYTASYRAGDARQVVDETRLSVLGL